MPSATVPPPAFRRAVAGLRATVPRGEIRLEEVGPPQRLAPYAFALSATVVRAGEDIATGRLVLLHDPGGHEGWAGTLRLVTYVTADLELDLAADHLLPTVGWTWLTDALEAEEAHYTALGGTVTQTLSTRFGDLAGPPTAGDIEVRASWTALTDDLAPHLRAWCSLLASTAGLPPPGVTALADRSRPGSG